MTAATTSKRRKSTRQRSSETDAFTPAHEERAPRPWQTMPKTALILAKSAGAALLLFSVGFALAPTKDARAPGHKVAERPRAAAVAHKAEKPAAEQKPAVKSAATALVSGNNVAVREAPKSGARVLDVAVYGSMVDVIGQDGKWTQVRASGQGVTGWVERAGLSF